MTISTNAQAVLNTIATSAEHTLTVPQYNSNLGVLAKKGLIAKNAEGVYELTSEGTEMAISLGFIVVEVEHVESNGYDYNEFTNRALGCIEQTDLNIRIVETKTKVEYIRMAKNDHKIRAFEVHHTRNIFRIYTGQQLNTETHEKMVEIGAEIKEGTHWYYDFPCDYVTINAVIASL